MAIYSESKIKDEPVSPYRLLFHHCKDAFPPPPPTAESSNETVVSLDRILSESSMCLEKSRVYVRECGTTIARWRGMSQYYEKMLEELQAKHKIEQEQHEEERKQYAMLQNDYNELLIDKGYFPVEFDATESFTHWSDDPSDKTWRVINDEDSEEELNKSQWVYESPTLVKRKRGCSRDRADGNASSEGRSRRKRICMDGTE